MMTPRAARTDTYGKRYYPVPHPTTHELHDLPSWTRLAKLLAAPGLETWKQKNVARVIAMRPDLQMLAADPETVWQAVKQALDTASEAANTGTGAHRFAELADKGVLDLDLVPAPARPFVSHYVEARERFGFEMIEAEVTVANFTIGYAGTADRFQRWPDCREVPGGGVVVADLKTGASVYPDVAFQLAAYANSETIWTPPADDDLPEFVLLRDAQKRNIANGTNVPPGRRKWSEVAVKAAQADIDAAYWEMVCEWPGHRPMPADLRTDLGVVLHLTADGCVPVVLRLDTETPALAVVGALRTVYGWQAGEAGVIVRDAPKPAATVPPEVDAAFELSALAKGGADTSDCSVEELSRILTVDERREYLRARIAHTANNSKALAGLQTGWPAGVPMLRTDVGHTHDTLDQVERLVNDVDAAHGVEFPAISQAEFVAPKTLDEGAANVLAAFPGSVELGGSAHRKVVLANRVAQLSKSKPTTVDALMAALEADGIRKSLRTAQWTDHELNVLAGHLTFAETGKSPTKQNTTKRGK